MRDKGRQKNAVLHPSSFILHPFSRIPSHESPLTNPFLKLGPTSNLALDILEAILLPSSETHRATY
jgi:hypothetical protein